MVTMTDIQKVAKIACGKCVAAIYDIDEMFEKRDVEWFIDRNLDVLERVFGETGYSENDLYEAAKDISGRDPEDDDEAWEIVNKELEEHFAYLMEKWWDEKIAELEIEAKTVNDGMTRVYRTYTEAPTAEFTHYTGTDYEKARFAAKDEYNHLTRREHESENVILCYVDFPAEEVKELSDEELRDLICGECLECRVVKAVWNKKLY